jgi:amino acid transporter
MIVSLVIFVIPMAFIAAELATGWSKRGGPEVWAKEAFGRRFGFLVSWLLWVQMFFGMVIISVGFATMIAFVVGNPTITTLWGNGSVNTYSLKN